MREASARSHRPIDYREDTEALLTRAGFSDITHRTVRIPLGSRARDKREASLKRNYKSIMCVADDTGSVSQTFEGLSLSLFTRQLRMPSEQVRPMCDMLRRICMTDEVPIYHTM